MRKTFPAVVKPALQAHLAEVKKLHRQDLAEGFGRVHLPGALARNTRPPPENGGGGPGRPAADDRRRLLLLVDAGSGAGGGARLRGAGGRRMPKTYPAYFGTYGRFGELQAFLDRFENLFLVGRNGMHKYNNQDHAMLTAMTAAENIAAGRTDKSNIWAVNTEEEYHEEKS